MKYKEYEAAVDFAEIKMFRGTVIDLRDVITFYGKSMAQLELESRI